MSIQDFANLQPFVRMVKIKRSVRLEGSWEDLDHVFIYNAKGNADWVISGKRWHLPEGSCLLIPPYLSHLIVKIGNEELVQYVLHVDLFEDAERKLLPHQSAFRFEQKPVLPEKETLLHGKVLAASIPRKERYTLERLFLNMYREFSQKSEGYELMLKGQAMQMAVMFLRNLPSEAKGSDVSSEQQAKSWRIVENALEYIYLHYSENLENAVIGDAAGVSPNYLSKLFQEYLGVSLHTYVQNYRLEKAQQLLISGKYNFIQPGDIIALDAGTTTYALAALLSGIPDLTIITNDLKIASYPGLDSSTHLILLGGPVRHGFHCTVGRAMADASRRFYFDKLFLAASAMSAARGFSTHSMECADAKRAMLALADQVIVLADSAKTQRSAFLSFASLQDADVIITDTDVPPEFLRAAKARGVQVICT